MARTVLITGASGFMAAHIVECFLREGYNVRGTVRSKKSAEGVRETHSQYSDRLSLVVVPDITAPNAFDEAVREVDGVIHTASPFVLNATDFENELFKPAVRGTTSLLEAVQKHSPRVSRVVITSSFAAVLDPSKGRRPDYVYTESDWNPVTAEDASSSGAVTAYLASKTFAEQAAWDYAKKQKPNFSVAILCPPMVYGPIIHRVGTVKDLNASSGDIYRLIDGSEKDIPDTSFWAFADVRDVAEAHLRAYESPEAAGQRYLIANSAYSYQQICDIIRDKFPNLRKTTPEGVPGAPLPFVYKLDTNKVVQQLGMNFRPLEETVTDTVSSLLRLER